ncbi:MAG: hypothetical protein HZB23_14210 [Deltaproteobacteria bacterium]|nr:hypothetical protein [Deltaproteobacteria bacterium]
MKFKECEKPMSKRTFSYVTELALMHDTAIRVFRQAAKGLLRRIGKPNLVDESRSAALLKDPCAGLFQDCTATSPFGQNYHAGACKVKDRNAALWPGALD